MNELRLDRRDAKHLIVWLCCGAFGLILFLHYYELAFPEASVKLTVNRDEVLERSHSYLQELGHDVEGYHSAVSFTRDSRAKNFLEKELGREEADALMGETVKVWYWLCRWFKPEQEEEFYVYMDPAGEAIGFYHNLPENAEGASLDAGEAQTIAEAFFRTFRPDFEEAYTLKSNSKSEEPNRLDHTFVWERDDFKAAEATYRSIVEVYGDGAGRYTEYLKIPEEWSRGEQRKDTRRNLFYSAAYLVQTLFQIGALIVCVVYFRRGRLNVNFAIMLGALLAVLLTLGWVNELSLTWMSYPTTSTVPAFFGGQALGLVMDVFNAVFTLLIIGAAANALNREQSPNRLPLSSTLAPSFWKSKETFIAAAVGLCLAMTHAAYVSLFYVLGERVGVWVPLDSPYMNLLATPMPWLYPLTIGFSAALNEEFLFRILAIPLVLRLTKSRVLAILLPAVVWGFLHSPYPQDPAYIRGIELTIVGIVYGLVFLRYGIVASFISHYAYNALVSSMVLLRSDNLYFQISGALIVTLALAPLLPGLALIVRRRSFATPPLHVPPDLVATVPKAPTIAVPERYPPWRPLRLRVYLIVAALGASMWLVGVLFHTENLGAYIEMKVTRAEAQEIGLDFIRTKGVEPDGFQVVTSFSAGFDGDEMEYLVEHLGVDELNEVCARHLPDEARWVVNLFVPLQKEEYFVYVQPRGTVSGYTHLLPEDAPGANLTRDEAEELARDFFALRPDTRLEDYELIDYTTAERENRTDHTFVWQYNDSGLGEGSFRVWVPVRGDELTSHGAYIDVPDEWYRERNETGLQDILMIAVVLILVLFGLVVVGYVFTNLFMQRRLRWRAGVCVAALAFATLLIGQVNSLPTFWDSYNTSSGQSAFILNSILGLGMLFVFGVPMLTLIVSATEALIQSHFPGTRRASSWLPRIPSSRPTADAAGKSDYAFLSSVWGEGLVLGLLIAPILLAPEPTRLYSLVPGNETPGLSIPGMYESYWPWMEILTESFGNALMSATALLLIVAFTVRFKRHYKIALILAGVALLAVTMSDAESILQFALDSIVSFVLSGVLLAVLYLYVRFVYRKNLIAYLAVPFMSSLLAGAVELISVPNKSMAIQGWGLLILFAILGMMGLGLLWNGKRLQDGGGSSSYTGLDGGTTMPSTGFGEA